MLSWHFKRRAPDDTTRDPISGEFFATEAIRGSAEALVREGIQNSLDARKGFEPVRVRIGIYTHELSAAPGDVAPFLHGLKPHLNCSGNGIQPEQMPAIEEPIPFVTFEDFGTKGLVGNPLQWHRVPNVTNGFFAFFRAEGENAKSDGGTRGRWGIGKFVFPRASYGSTFFGWSVRSEGPQSVLLGRCILKSHTTAGVVYVPDGYFGVQKTLDAGTITAPVDDATSIHAFKNAFRLTRASETGLSLVIPWPDKEIQSRTILDAAIRDWFWCLMSGELVVEVVDRAGTVLLSRDTLRDEVERLSDEDVRDLLPLLDLSRYALEPDGGIVAECELPDQQNKPRWRERMLNDETLAMLRTRLESAQPIGVRVPIIVRRKGDEPASSYLDIFVKRDPDYDYGRPVFVRQGIIVSDARGNAARGFRSLVVCEHEALADLLGNAENPAHTEWRPDTANFKDRYTYGKGYIEFVRSSVLNLIRQIEQDEDDTAPDLLLDFFSLPEATDAVRPNKVKRTAKAGGDDPPPEPEIPQARTRRYRVSQIEGGFTVRPGGPDSRTPAKLDVSVAYDVRKGDAFKRYDPADFQLLRDGIEAKPQSRGLKLIEYSANRISWSVTDPDFHVSFVGFDTNRDLVVRVVASGEFDGADV